MCNSTMSFLGGDGGYYKIVVKTTYIRAKYSVREYLVNTTRINAYAVKKHEVSLLRL